ncbi:LRP2 binding protein [Rhizopus stolonifer]|uniref:LRP2 binding protein n=1 Tax=Rhizopus stolonifer TaxID=4846 RepID=A0A367JXG7_RHIST|nr:LRP2 binding protein [Rhizopus stolonifer]
MTVEEHQILESIPEDLKLIQCVTLIQSCDDLEVCLEALNFLRLKATEQQDTEAKTKLSILYMEDQMYIGKNEVESVIWSRSVFDKQLSSALQLASGLFASRQTNGLEIIEGSLDKDPHASYLAGILYTKGIGFTQDLEKGVRLLKYAATEGKLGEAACELGRIYGDRYKYSYRQSADSVHWFERAFECGSNQAIVDLAYSFFEGSPDVPKDDGRAFRYAKDGSLSNDKYCQYIVGHLYLKGRGVEQDTKEALRWLDESAKQGFSVALEEQVAVYMNGQGNVAKDYQKAYQCCTQGTAANIPYCQVCLGDLYRNGWGVKQDYQRAFELYQSAASTNQSDTPYPYAQHMIGEMFLHGEGVPKDLAIAKEWFQIASTQGYEPSQVKIQQISLLEENTLQKQKEAAAAAAAEQQQQTQEKRSSRWSLGFFRK